MADSVTPCGHTFSEEGLHGYFQNAVIQELRRLRYFYSHIAVDGLTPQDFDREFLLDLRAHTGLFKPTYACGTCRKAIVSPPVRCSAFSHLTEKLQELVGLEDAEPQFNASSACDLTDYFVFYVRNTF
jgi:hypothetical protein